MAESKGFDVTDFLKSVPDLDTGRQQIVYLPIEQIDADPDNFYSLDGIDELAGSIEMLGLQQPLLVRPGEGGKYVVISGHRRRAAILLIRDGGSQQFAEGVPCIIDLGTASEALREFKLIMGNMDTRKMSSADENKQAERVEVLLVKLEDEGFQFSGRRRDWVAKITGMSRSKLGRLKVIRDRLAPEIKEKYYDKGNMNENAAYTLAQQPVDVQREIVRQYLSTSKYYDDLRFFQADFTPKYLERTQKLAELRCPVNKGSACINQKKLLDKIYSGNFPPCRDCKTCCAKCDEFARCGNRCSLMDAKAKEKRDAQREASKQERAKEKSQKEADIWTIEHIWARFGQALIGAGMTDKELRAMLNKDARNYKEFDLYMDAKRLESLLDFSCTDVKQNEYLPFHYSFRIDDFMRLVRIADALGVSLDYLFLRSEHPEGGLKAGISKPETARESEAEEEGDTFVNFSWKWGAPAQNAEGWYVVKAQIDADLMIRRTLYWDGRYWNINDKPGSPRISSEIKVAGWFPLPPDEDASEEGEA